MPVREYDKYCRLTSGLAISGNSKYAYNVEKGVKCDVSAEEFQATMRAGGVTVISENISGCLKNEN